jgi:hypothetical protein
MKSCLLGYNAVYPGESQPTLRRNIALNRALLDTCLMFVFCLVYSSTLKMAAITSCETLVDFYRTTWWYMPEGTSFQSHRCENLRSRNHAIIKCVHFSWTFTYLFQVLGDRAATSTPHVQSECPSHDLGHLAGEHGSRIALSAVLHYHHVQVSKTACRQVTWLMGAVETLWLYSFCWALAAFSVSWSCRWSVGLLGRDITPSQHTIQTSIPWMGFEPRSPASERAKTVHTLYEAATVISIL